MAFSKTACLKWIVFSCAGIVLISCDSKDHQLATLEKDSGREQYLEAAISANPEERYAEYRKIMSERLERNQVYLERFKLEKVKLKREKRGEYEEAIDLIEVQISTMRDELENFGSSDGEEWDSFIEYYEQNIEKIEYDLRQLTIY